ncbi:hypothetical protein CCO02nite_30190 [Cellulomonas composti]|uniref:Uncharacterized protein n=1 Tax=Cellulomonas composti TaxID=266130 RepID=A0A511JEE7_9CELL|nr:hypothetical protein CCO02nite_30190 [Cellulomonas composti]
MTRLAQQLAVLLLGHPLAALLDDGTHGPLSLPVRPGRPGLLLVDRRVVRRSTVESGTQGKSEAPPYAITGPDRDARASGGQDERRSVSRSASWGTIGSDVAR